jgi:hypothetical protein
VRAGEKAEPNAHSEGQINNRTVFRVESLLHTHDGTGGKAKGGLGA